MTKKIIRYVATIAGAALLLSAASGASAAPLTFVWNPLGATPPLVAGGPIGPANNMIVSDFASVTLTGGGNFTEVGYLNILQFLLTGSPAPQLGLGSTYSLYFGFNGTGTGVVVPGPGLSSSFPFTKLDYTLFAIPGPTPTFTVTNGNVTVSGAGAFPLAFGSMLSGTATLTNTPGAPGQPFSPTANLFETFNICTAAGQGNAGFGQALCTANESGFFPVPPPGTINLVVGNFSATTTETSFDGTFLNITGGGGNLTLERRVPEPMSLLLLGVGILGLAGLSRLRTAKR
jgi:hypothetical protein